LKNFASGANFEEQLQMSKFDKLRAWRLVKARISHRCDACWKIIEAKAHYWAEYLSGGVRPPPGMKFGKLYRDCYSKNSPV
jgi:hypothetical protein